MCPSLVEIRSVTSEIRRRKKKKKRKKQIKKEKTTAYKWHIQPQDMIFECHT